MFLCSADVLQRPNARGAGSTTADEASGDEQSEPVNRTNEQPAPTEVISEIAGHVTLAQMAAIVNKSKRTLEWLKDDKMLPAPAVKGGNGRADEWLWSAVKPVLEAEYRRVLPDVFPADRFIRR